MKKKMNKVKSKRRIYIEETILLKKQKKKKKKRRERRVNYINYKKTTMYTNYNYIYVLHNYIYY